MVDTGEGKKAGPRDPPDVGFRLQRCSQPSAFSPACCFLLLPVQETYPSREPPFKVTQIRVTSKCDYLKANDCLLHHPWLFPAFALSLLLLAISLSLTLTPETVGGTGEEATRSWVE